MTTTTIPHTSAGRAARRLTFSGVLRSEWIKLLSLRSTVWSYAILLVLTLALAALLAYTADPTLLPGADQVAAATTAATFGVFFGQLIVAVLGVLVITGEYSTGQIRSSLTAVPTRLPVLGAKAIVLFVTSFVVSAASMLLSYALATSILISRGAEAEFMVSDAVGPIAGTAFYVAVIAVFALGLGAIIRNTGGGVAAALGVILLLPLVFALIPISWVNDAQAYLLNNAGLAISGGASPLDTWQQFVVTAVWVVASLGLGAVLLTRRDA